MIRIKVDEDLPTMVVQTLQDKGYEVSGVVEQGMGGWKDPLLWQAIQAEGRFLVTADKGCADIRTYSPGSHAGVLLLRPDEDGIRPTLQLLEQVLNSFELTVLSGTVTVATPRGIRIRRGEA